MEDLAGKVAFVTGGASGIGLAMAQSFAGDGVKLVLADIEVDALEKAERDLRESGAEVVGVRCDVSDRASVEAAAERAFEAFGKVHVVCNNAGVAPSGALDETTAEDWKWCVGVNLMGVVHGIQTLIPRIKAHGEGGHVVNTASDLRRDQVRRGRALRDPARRARALQHQRLCRLPLLRAHAASRGRSQPPERAGSGSGVA
jgi:NAD(P)-dependent dehydrogenase (short-subunit alcohol dehydrogenase family)